MGTIQRAAAKKTKPQSDQPQGLDNGWRLPIQAGSGEVERHRKPVGQRSPGLEAELFGRLMWISYGDPHFAGARWPMISDKLGAT
jgi:hypothetical protein